jgi:hypothetical protein
MYILKFLILHIKLFSEEHLTKENVTFCGKFSHGGKKRKENTYRGANTILPSKPIIGYHLKVSMEKKRAKNILGFLVSIRLVWTQQVAMISPTTIM